MLKDVPGYEGFYVISDDGEVFNTRGRKLRGWVNKDGYPCVGLRKRGPKKSFLVHRLVLLAFSGPAPKGFEARHMDGNPANCSLGNLQWGSKIENEKDKVRHGTRLLGSMVKGSKLSEKEVIELRYRVLNGEREESLSKEYGVHAKTITSVVNGRKWKHLPGAIKRQRKTGKVIQTGS